MVKVPKIFNQIFFGVKSEIHHQFQYIYEIENEQKIPDVTKFCIFLIVHFPSFHKIKILGDIMYTD